MALQRYRSRHAGLLALISAGFTLLLSIPLLVRLADTWVQARSENETLRRRSAALEEALLPARHAEARVSTYLQVFGRKGKLPTSVVFLPIDSNSTTLRDVPPEEIAASPALSLIAESGFPFPRAIYPLIMDRLFSAGAKVVGFDLRFPNAREGDDQFRAALDRYSDRVVIGTNFITGEKEVVAEENAETVEKPGLRPMLEMPSKTLIPTGDQGDGRLGFVNFRPEEDDGLVRYAFYRTSLLEYFGVGTGPVELWSLAARMARQAGHEALVPAEHRSWMIRFLEQKDLRPVSLHDIFSERLWARPPFNGGAFFKNKIVFIGPYGNWVKDDLETPLGITLGPQIHLSALSSILNQDFLTESSAGVDLAVLLLAGLAAWLIGVQVGHPGARSVLLLAAAALYVGGAFALFNSVGFCLKLLGPNLTLLLSGGVGLVWERVAERAARLAEKAERERVRRTLERYVSRDVVQEVLDNPRSFLHTLGGERRCISILFSDVRGFTTLTEKAEDASLLVRQINEYFTEMVRIVFENYGTLDKFIGDAVMATWGGIAARSEKEDACSAVAAALQMLRELKRLNPLWKERGMVELKIGIGVNHGEAICGHLGSEQKQEFSALGDAVNLSSRLEGATKEFHVDLLIGENVARLVKHCQTVRTVDLLQVKGKTMPVEVFTVLDEDPPAWLAHYEEGVRCYRARAFVEAERAFTAAAEARPEDWLIQEYLRRTQACQAVPPPPDWDGVYVMTQK